MSDELKKAMRRARVANARVAELLKAQEKRAKADGETPPADGIKIEASQAALYATKDSSLIEG